MTAGSSDCIRGPRWTWSDSYHHQSVLLYPNSCVLPDTHTSSQAATMASPSTSAWTDEEKKALSAFAELYSGFVNERDVAAQLARLSIPIERLEEILRHRLHPALYTQLAWRGTGFEAQKALPLEEVESRIAATDPAAMNFITRTASNKAWDWGMQSTWNEVKSKVEQLRRSEGRS